MNIYGSSWIRREKRVAIYMRDGYKCVYCGVCLMNSHARKRTLDHVIPRIHGGTNDHRNLVTCCLACNDQKGDSLLQCWRSDLIPIVRQQVIKPIDIRAAKRRLTELQSVLA